MSVDPITDGLVADGTGFSSLPIRGSGRSVASAPRPRLLIAHHDAVLRSGLAAEMAGTFELVAVARDAGEAIAMSELFELDALLVAIGLPGGGARAVRAIRGDAQRVVAVMLDGGSDRSGVSLLPGSAPVSCCGAGAPAHALVARLSLALGARPAPLRRTTVLRAETRAPVTVARAHVSTIAATTA